MTGEVRHELDDADRAEIARRVYSLRDALDERLETVRGKLYIDLDVSANDNPTPREQILLDALNEDELDLDRKVEDTIDGIIRDLEKTEEDPFGHRDKEEEEE